MKLNKINIPSGSDTLAGLYYTPAGIQQPLTLIYAHGFTSGTESPSVADVPSNVSAFSVTAIEGQTGGSSTLATFTDDRSNLGSRLKSISIFNT